MLGLNWIHASKSEPQAMKWYMPIYLSKNAITPEHINLIEGRIGQLKFKFIYWISNKLEYMNHKVPSLALEISSHISVLGHR